MRLFLALIVLCFLIASLAVTGGASPVYPWLQRNNGNSRTNFYESANIRAKKNLGRRMCEIHPSNCANQWQDDEFGRKRQAIVRKRITDLIRLPAANDHD